MWQFFFEPSHIILEDLFCATLLYNIASADWKLQAFCWQAAPLRILSHYLIRLKSGLWLDRCNTSGPSLHPAADSPLGSETGLSFSRGLSRAHLALDFYRRILWWCVHGWLRDVDGKQAQISVLPPPCLTVGERCLLNISALDFSKKHYSRNAPLCLDAIF